jgi:hypothetical protein
MKDGRRVYLEQMGNVMLIETKNKPPGLQMFSKGLRVLRNLIGFQTLKGYAHPWQEGNTCLSLRSSRAGVTTVPMSACQAAALSSAHFWSLA